MPTIKPRLNITLSPDVESAVNDLAKRDKTSRAGKVTELLRIALEIEEDQIWNSIAEKRDSKKSNFVPHNKAWN